MKHKYYLLVELSTDAPVRPRTLEEDIGKLLILFGASQYLPATAIITMVKVIPAA